MQHRITVKNSIVFFLIGFLLFLCSENASAITTPIATVDTFCDHWHICVHDAAPLADALMTNAYKMQFDVISDPQNDKEIIFNGTDTVTCFDVYVVNVLDSAHASIDIADKNGYHLIVSLRYKSPNLKLLKEPNLTNLDSLIYPISQVGKDTCYTLVYFNSAGNGGKNVSILSTNFRKNNGRFSVLSTMPSLPTTLRPGDSLFVEVCFTPADTLNYIDSLIVETDCFYAPLPLIGKGGTPLIFATDLDFGNVPLGATKCSTVTITNRGTLPLLLKKGLFQSSVFSLNPNYANRLGHILKPGESIVIGICYTPTHIGARDSSTVDWVNDIDAPFKGQVKPWSFLNGTPVRPSLIWNTDDQFFRFDSTSGVESVVQRVILSNNSNSAAQNVKVIIDGENASEFFVFGDSLGFLPLQNFDMAVNQQIWVDIQCKPDLTKPYPKKFADRHANLVAIFGIDNNKDSATMSLTGTWAKSEVKNLFDGQTTFSIRPNPASGNSVLLSFNSLKEEKGMIRVFDILGREMYHAEIPLGLSEATIPLINFDNGIYYIRLQTATGIYTQKLEIMR
jgi:hypothetical protein